MPSPDDDRCFINKWLSGASSGWRQMFMASEAVMSKVVLNKSRFPKGLGVWYVPADEGMPSLGFDAPQESVFTLYRRRGCSLVGVESGFPGIGLNGRYFLEKVTMIIHCSGGIRMVDVSIMPDTFMEGLMPHLPPGIARRFDQMYARFREVGGAMVGNSVAVGVDGADERDSCVQERKRGVELVEKTQKGRRNEPRVIVGVEQMDGSSSESSKSLDIFCECVDDDSDVSNETVACCSVNKDSVETVKKPSGVIKEVGGKSISEGASGQSSGSEWSGSDAKLDVVWKTATKARRAVVSGITNSI